MRIPHRTLLVILALSLFLVPTAKSEPDTGNSPLEKAEASYRAGKYQEAVDTYEALLRDRSGAGANLDPAALFFNAGTSAQRLGKLGLARSFYLSGLRLSPFDSDLRANLQKLEERLRNQAFWVHADTTLPFETNPQLYLLADWWLVVVLALLLLHGIVLAPLSGRMGLKTVSLLVIVGMGIGFPLISSEALVKTALVVADEETVRSGPGDAFPELAKIGAGSSLLVRATQGDWHKVSFLTAGAKTPSVGWVQNRNLRSLGE